MTAEIADRTNTRKRSCIHKIDPEVMLLASVHEPAHAIFLVDSQELG